MFLKKGVVFLDFYPISIQINRKVYDLYFYIQQLIYFHYLCISCSATVPLCYATVNNVARPIQAHRKSAQYSSLLEVKSRPLSCYARVNMRIEGTCACRDADSD